MDRKLTAKDIVSGVKEDFELLIYNHSKKNSYDFNDFIATWNDSKFYFIFSGRKTLEEMKFFVEHSLMIIKDIFLFGKKSGSIVRTASIYLLYMFFKCQPLVEKVRIRIELQELKTMHEFVSKEKVHSKDLAFAFHSLLLQDAFSFVFSQLKRFPEKTGVINVRETSFIKSKPYHGEPEVLFQKLVDGMENNTVQFKKAEKDYNSDLEKIMTMVPELMSDFDTHDLIHEISTAFKEGSVQVTQPKASKSKIRPSSKAPRLKTVLSKGETTQVLSTTPDSNPEQGNEVDMDEVELKDVAKSLPIIFSESDDEPSTSAS